MVQVALSILQICVPKFVWPQEFDALRKIPGEIVVTVSLVIENYMLSKARPTIMRFTTSFVVKRKPTKQNSLLLQHEELIVDLACDIELATTHTI